MVITWLSPLNCGHTDGENFLSLSIYVLIMEIKGNISIQFNYKK
jgi:hypothetical protein